ncbi:MAG: hypothetical protein AB3N18_18905 [Allomuricauda sp.]
MTRFRLFAAIVLFMLVFKGLAQNKYEQEYRVSESEFPSIALKMISPYLNDAKRIRFYQEIDSVKKSFEVKFKKGKLRYSVEFDEQGQLEDVEFLITPDDIPEESWSQINSHLKSNFQKARIKKIQQQYPVGNSDSKKVLKEAFQNLILEYINYELIFTTKEDKGFQTYEGLFNASGKLIRLRKSFSPKYDHLLY